jgi:hypothetical protein
MWKGADERNMVESVRFLSAVRDGLVFLEQ